MLRRHRLPLLLSVLLLAPACQSSAGEGAARGAAVGALSSGVVSAVFGGDVGRSMAYGAVGGAVSGGIAGAASDQRASEHEQQEGLAAENARLETQNRALQLRQELIARIGVDNTEAIAQLIECRHDAALGHLRSARTSGNAEFELASVWLEATLELDRRDTAAARALYPVLAERDEDAATVADAEATTLELVTNLEDMRVEFGRPRRCK